MSWWVVFLPIWVANGLIFILHLASFINIWVSFKHISQKQNRVREAQSNAFKACKTVSFWNCCTPFGGVLPSTFMLAFVMWFEGVLCAKLQGATGSSFIVGIPLDILALFLMTYAVLMRTMSWLPGLGVACAIIELVLVPLRVEKVITVSWFAILAPLWVFALFVTVYTIYIGGNDCAFNTVGRVQLSTSQRVYVGSSWGGVGWVG
jgi:hypothetical protein